MSPETLAPRSFPEQVADATGLAGMLALGSLRRCCKRANVELHNMTCRDLARVLPYLQPMLELYLTAEETRTHMVQLTELAEHPPSAHPPARATLAGYGKH
jgi:hypothetical protein